MKLHRAGENGELFLVHVTGNCPHAVNGWSRPYGSLSQAMAQANLALEYPRRHRPDDTDWVAVVHEHPSGDIAAIIRGRES